MYLMVYSIVFVCVIIATIYLGYHLLPWLQAYCASGKRAYTPEHHEYKSETPSLGGIIFIPLIICIGLIYITISHNWFTSWPVIICASFAGIGLYDDVCKLWCRVGVSESFKFILQALFSGVFATYWYLTMDSTLVWHTPIGLLAIPSGLWVIPWFMFIIIGVSNAVNLTDGVDGLAATSVLWHACASGVILSIYAVYLDTCMSWYGVWLSAIAGAGLGFLWHNAYPARIFMGDVGSISLGAVCAVLAVMSGTEWFLPFTLVVPMLETVSVILQVAVYKITGARLFKLAPLHHHFELIGWHESHIVTRAAIVSLISTGLVTMLISFFV